MFITSRRTPPRGGDDVPRCKPPVRAGHRHESQVASHPKLVREEVAGTGMYEGMVTTGIAKEVVPPKEIQPGETTFCNQATGTYKMK